ncbi:hypothetical protein GCM10009623_30830 [Nocardioides aestuarii]|uniref:HNH endonuclease signature motif containing protein n=1 Tax=Nocardioides aestuarii TaxID=252231 RepID=A0ABW4TQJ3_9ACTN
MFDTLADADTGAATAADVLARAASERSAADAAEARLLQQAAVWADLHPPESIHHAATFGHAVPGSEHEVPIAGAGCPLVAEFCIAELAAALAMSTTAGKRLIGHALELRHRLPRLWATVHSGQVPAWRARRVAEATIHADLTPAGATFVDQMVTPFAHAVGIAQLDRIIAEALQRYGTHSPSPDPEGGDRVHDSRFVQIDPPLDPYGGTALLRGELDPADALDLEAALATGAAALKDLGSQASLDVRRSMALGDLARRQNSLDYDHDEESAGFEARSARTSTTGRYVVLRVGLAAAVTGEGPGSTVEFDRLATLDQGQLQVLLDQVKSWCAATHTAVTVQPVLDLAARIRSRGYQPSAFLREQVIERDRTCVFPWCSRPARGCQLDHIEPYDPDPDADADADGPSGTHTDNLACLCTFHHRLKTHGGWTYRMLSPGEYEWTSPHGHHYLRDHTGTRQQPRP